MAQVETTETPPAKTSRRTIATKVYVYADGTEGRHARPDVERLEFRFADDTVLTVGGVHADCERAAAWHGKAQKIGDGYNKAEDAASAYESAAAMLERLVAGEWVKPGEAAGPRIGIVVEAIARCLEEAGEAVNDARRAKIAEKIATKEAREAALANEAIDAMRKVIVAERAIARADAAREAVGETTKASLKGF